MTQTMLTSLQKALDMKDAVPPPPVTPTGVIANLPKRVPDDLEAIAAALGEKI